MKLKEILLEVKSEFIDKHEQKFINKISKLLFNQESGPVKDLKRSKTADFWGVSHQKSIFKDEKGKQIKLTFDNSTDSGEFEINSLTPLKIKKGSNLDKSIKTLYKECNVKSEKKMNYIIIDNETVLREIHLGKNISNNEVEFVKSLIKLITA